MYVYPIARITEWYGWQGAIEWYGALILWIVVCFGLWASFSGRVTFVKHILVNWLGVGFIFFSLCAIYEIVRVFVQVDDQKAAIWIVVLGLIISVFAFVMAQKVAHKHVEIKSHKLGKNYRVVQISDVHVDYVLITGDLVDTSKVGHHELSALRDIVATAYFIIGNHERYVGLHYVLPMLEELGLSILRNDSVIVEDIQFIGIDDAEDPEHVAKTLPSIEMHHSKFKILLYHRPLGWPSASDQGVELMLSGHTHNGQIFPFNWLVKQQFRLIKGMYREGNSHLYVSPGTGTWGPVMRLGSRNEITCIDLVSEASDRT